MQSFDSAISQIIADIHIEMLKRQLLHQKILWPVFM